MRKKIEYYNGKEITRSVLKIINLIDLTRIKEGINAFSMESVKTLRSLCKEHESDPEEEYIILGEDWYIIYTKKFDTEIDIKDCEEFRKNVNTQAMCQECKRCYQSSHANWNNKSSFIQVGEEFAPTWEK